MSPQPQEKPASMLSNCSLICHNVPSIISRESMYKHMQFWSNFEITKCCVVTVNIRSRSIKSNSLFSVSKQITCIYACLVQNKTFGSEDRAQKRLNL